MSASAISSRPLSRRSPAALAALALIGAGLMSAPASADGPIAVDCSVGPVTLAEANADYVVTGVCSSVTIAASNTTVSLPDVPELAITKANAEVRAGTVGTARLSGGNTELSASGITLLTVSGANSEVRVGAAGLAGPTRILAANVELVTPQAGAITVKGANTDVKVRGRATSFKLRGSNGEAVFGKLKTLSVVGSNNTVKARKGKTKVLKIRGANNVVKVRERGKKRS